MVQGASLHARDMWSTLQASPGSSCCAYGLARLQPGGAVGYVALQLVEANSQQALSAQQGVDLEESMCVHVPSCVQAVACRRESNLVCLIAACRMSTWRGALLNAMLPLPDWPCLDEIDLVPCRSAGR